MGEKRGMKALEAWCRKVTIGYRDVHVENMTTSFKDGLAFCAIIHHFHPELMDYDSLSKKDVFYNNNLAFTVAEQHLGIPALLDAEDMVMCRIPDKLSIMTYVSQLYKYFHDLEESVLKSPTKRSLEERDSISSMAEPPGKLLPQPLPTSTDVSSTHIQRIDNCHVCRTRVYILERLIVDNKLYHRTCFKCNKCQSVLRPGSYVEDEECETYECIQCPTEEEKEEQSNRPHSAVIAALRGFTYLPTDANSLSPFRNLKDTKNHSQVAEQFNGTSTSNEEESSVITGTGQEIVGDLLQKNTLPLASTTQKFAASNNIVIVDKAETLDDTNNSATSLRSCSTRADVQNNNVLPEEREIIIVDRVHSETSLSSGEKDIAVDSNEPNSLEPVIRRWEVLSSESLSPARPPIPKRPQSLQLQKEDDDGDVVLCVPNEQLDAASSNKRKTVSEMVKIFARDKESFDAQRVAVVYPQQSVLPRNGLSQDGDNGSVGDRKGQTETYERLIEESKSPLTISPDQQFVPQAAPRSSKSKSVTLEPQFTSLTTLDTHDEADASVDDQDVTNGTAPSPPQKPPRIFYHEPTAHDVSVVTDSSNSGVTSEGKALQSEYPDHLNPFGEHDDEGDIVLSVTESSAEKKSLNPFGSSEDESADGDDTAERPTIRKNVVRSLNPFSSDSDDDQCNDVSSSRLPPVPTARQSVARIAPTPSPRQGVDKSISKTMTLGYKKRLAPKPPSSSNPPSGSGSATSSPFVTPVPSPRPFRKPAAPPPPPPPSDSSPILTSPKQRQVDDADVSSSNDTKSFDASSPNETSDGSDPCLKEKSLKDFDNMNLTRVSSSSAQTVTSADSTISPDTSGSPSKPPNTFGYWKRKKKPAPPIPVPHRRLIAKLPMKEIQAELANIESIQLELEKKGVEIEKMIREKFSDDVEPSIEEEDLIMQLFELVNKKNALFRRQAELIYLKRQQRLEEEHADLEYQIRCLMEKPGHLKTEEDEQREEKLIARLVDVVHKRNEIIESMELDRQREVEEDQSIQERMALKKGHAHHDSLSSQGSFGSISSSASSKGEKSKKHEKKKKKGKESKWNDEDKDLDETEVCRKAKEEKKKRKWF